MADLRAHGRGVRRQRRSASGSRRPAARRTELPFVYELGGVLVNGVVDVHAAEDDGALVVDYKSDPVEGLDLAAYCDERYSTQRRVYALAGLRSGADRVEVAYVFLERPDEPVSAVFEAADASAPGRRAQRDSRPASWMAASSRATSPTAGSARAAPGGPRSAAMMRR